MTQPAVTRAIQELEQHYGVRLFERLYRHLSPTEAAQRPKCLGRLPVGYL